MRRVCAFALVALLSLSALSSSVLAQTVLTVVSRTGQSLVASTPYSTFNGAFESFQVSNSAPVTSTTAGEANLVLKCAKGIKVLAPASGCLSQDPIVFYVQVEEQNTAGTTINTPCTFSLTGELASNFSVSTLNADLGRPWAVSAASKLIHDEFLTAQGLSASSPRTVWEGTTFVFNYTRAEKDTNTPANPLAFQPVGSISVNPVCTYLSKNVQSLGVINAGDVTGSWSVEFGNLVDTGNVYCEFTISTSDPKDHGRFLPLPPVYFRVVAESKRTQIKVSEPVGGWMFNGLTNETNVLQVSPKPSLGRGEWLSIWVDGCSDATLGRGRMIIPGLGAANAKDARGVTYGVDATSNEGPAVILPPFVAGSLYSVCTLQIDGSPAALNRYELFLTRIVINTGKVVTIQAVFDQTTELPSNANPVADSSVPRIKFTWSDAKVYLGTLELLVQCTRCPETNTAAFDLRIPGLSSPDYIVVAWPNLNGDFVDPTNITAAPYYEFAPYTVGVVTCNYLLKDKNLLSVNPTADWFVAPPTQTFNVRAPYEFSITANNGVSAPSSKWGSGWTPLPIAPELASSIALTVAAPGFDVTLGLNCSGAAAQPSGSDLAFVTPGFGIAPDFATLTWLKSSSKEGKIALPVTLLTRPTTDQLVRCQWVMGGNHSGLFAKPDPIDFLVGKPVRLAAVTSTPPGDGKFRINDGSAPEVGVATVNITVAAGEDAAATAYENGFIVDWTCISQYTETVTIGTTSTVQPVELDSGSVAFPGDMEIGSSRKYSFDVASSHTTEATVATCTYSWPVDTSSATPNMNLAGLDRRHFVLPTPTIIRFEPQIEVKVTGTVFPNGAVVENGPIEQYNVFNSGAKGSIVYTPATLPVGDEELIVSLVIPGITGVNASEFKFTAAGPSSATYEFTMPTQTAETGNFYVATWMLKENAHGKWLLSSETISFVVGKLASFTQLPANADLPPAYFNEEYVVPQRLRTPLSDALTLVPSQCLGASTLSALCKSGRVRFGPSRVPVLTLGAATTAVEFYYRAPAQASDAPDAIDDVCVFKHVYGTTAIAFSTPAPFKVRVQKKATFVVSGVAHLPVFYDIDGNVRGMTDLTLSVAPTEVPRIGKGGVTAYVKCGEKQTTSSITTMLYEGFFYFFEGDATPQSFVISEAAQEDFANRIDHIPSKWYCYAEADTMSHGGVSSEPLALGQLDQQHFVRSNSAIMNVGNPWSFSFSQPGKWIRTPSSVCEADVPMNVTITMNQALLWDNVQVYPNCHRVDWFVDEGATLPPTARDVDIVSSTNSGDYVNLKKSDAPDCPKRSAWFLIYSNGYEGDIECRWTVNSGEVNSFALPSTLQAYSAPVERSEGGLTDGEIAGIVVGSVCGSILIGAAIYFGVKAASGGSSKAVANSGGRSSATPNGASNNNGVELPQVTNEGGQV